MNNTLLQHVWFHPHDVNSISDSGPYFWGTTTVCCCHSVQTCTKCSVTKQLLYFDAMLEVLEEVVEKTVTTNK